MKFIDLFAGIGGFHLGLKRHEHECIWSNEWDEFSRAVYKKHFGECDGRDVRTIAIRDIPYCELLCAGFPCQDFSVAGGREGFTGDRGALWFEVHRLIEGKRPPYFLLENVAGLFSVGGGKPFAHIIGTLEQMGYCVQWACFNSKYFGVPQNRERVFIVGSIRGEPRPEIFHFEEGIYDDRGEEGGQERPQDSKDIANAIDANYYKGPDMKGMRTLVQIGNIDTKGHNSIWGRVYSPEGIAPNITDGGGLGAKTGLIAVEKVLLAHTKANIKQRQQPLDKTWCLDTTGSKMGILAQSETEIGIRKLTPMECERVQGFPDEWTKYGVKDNGETIEISDSQRYKQLGNAVTVNVIEHFGKALRRING